MRASRSGTDAPVLTRWNSGRGIARAGAHRQADPRIQGAEGDKPRLPGVTVGALVKGDRQTDQEEEGRDNAGQDPVGEARFRLRLRGRGVQRGLTFWPRPQNAPVQGVAVHCRSADGSHTILHRRSPATSTSAPGRQVGRARFQGLRWLGRSDGFLTGKDSQPTGGAHVTRWQERTRADFAKAGFTGGPPFIIVVRAAHDTNLPHRAGPEHSVTCGRDTPWSSGERSEAPNPGSRRSIRVWPCIANAIPQRGLSSTRSIGCCDARTLALLEAVPDLRRDPNLGATNEGVTRARLGRALDGRRRTSCRRDSA